MRMRPPFFLRTRGRLVLTLAAGLLLPLALLAALVTSRSHATLRLEARGQSEREALLAARIVDEHFGVLVRIAESYARRPGLAARIRADAPARVRAHLAEIVEEDPTIDRAFFADPEGVELYDFPHVEAVIGQDFSHRDWYRGVSREDRTYVSEVYQRAAPPRHHLVAVATPVWGRDEALLGYLVIQRTVHELASWLRELPRERGGRVWLFGRRGHVAMAEGPEQMPPDLSERGIERRTGSGRVGTAEQPDPFSGEPSLVSYARVPAIGGSVVVSRPLATVLAPARALERWTYGLAGGVALAMTALGFVWLNTVRRQHLELAELDERKDTLTQMIVHDIRNPLASARMLVDTHRDAGAGKPARATAELEEALQRIQLLVENLLDITKLEEGQMALHRERTDVSALLARTFEAHRPAAERAEVELVTDGTSGVEAEVDPDLATRITENLVANAIKHTPPGGTVHGRVHGGDEGVTLEVSDTGEGIPDAEIPRLFRKFGRVESQRGTTRKDTGLGLVFCRMAAERHGGDVEVRARPGHGSTFRVRLPAA